MTFREPDFAVTATVGNMEAKAIIFEKPGRLVVDDAVLAERGEGECVVDTLWSSISTGTERLLWNGDMPEFPGMGYPLVPGYETVGEIVDASTTQRHRIGERVFVPGCSAYKEVRGLFGGAASSLVVASEKIVRVPEQSEEEAVLLALAATAYHALALEGTALPRLIVGHGILGRLVARLCVALGGEAPTIWEKDKARCFSADGFKVISPENDDGRQYASIMDLSGDASMLNRLVSALSPGGEIVLAGFYSQPISFAFPPAFMKEARFRVSAEWQAYDLVRVRDLVEEGLLSLRGLITHHSEVGFAASAYETAFTEPECLKMVLNWKEAA